jgi:thiamine-monophosphate kinase
MLARIRARVAAAGRSENVRLGIGDDCALIAVKAGEEIAVTTDLSIAGRHFELAWHPPEAIGHRVLARGLSDLAAMGARPVAAFLSLGIPKELTGKAGGAGNSAGWIDRFYDGLLTLAREFQTPLAGGDLAQSPIAVADILLLGAVRHGRALLRSGARPGDAIYVTGSLGGAAAGLTQLSKFAKTRRAIAAGRLRISAKLEAALDRHLYPQPRIRQGLFLASRRLAGAVIDLSDGLSTDLRHLCEESGVAAEVNADAVPISSGATLRQALNGGEDYELLFTARTGAKIPRAIGGVPVTRIGIMVKRAAKRPIITLVAREGREALDAQGWEHFA